MTILFNSPIFGPVHSRRLGVSLGINLMPADGKICSFDCIYCECGLNGDHHTKSKRPTREEVCEGLTKVLRERHEKGEPLDVITFAGNGEPTGHPDFAGIINDTIAARDKYFPSAKVSVLSNATMLHKPDVFEALKKVDNNIQKLDTVDMAYITKVDRPCSPSYDVRKVIKQLKAYDGKVIIQTIFMRGEGVDNTGEEYVAPWIEAVKEIAPEQVMIYTIDRETPTKGLKKAEPAILDQIRERITKLNIPCTASY
jgi:wyosine [tRNA(Phe)-imidazoG37] synthetase (radical SAM superfamily)